MIQRLIKKLKRLYKHYIYEKEVLRQKARDTKTWVIKIIPHGKNFAFSYNLTKKRILVFLLIFIVAVGSFLAFSQRAAIKLAVNNKKLERQNKQIKELLEKQNKEILTQLEEVKKNETDIKKIMGIKPKKKSSRDGKKVSVMSARRGMDHAELAVKIKELQKNIQATKIEQEKLKTQAVKYRVRIEKEKIVKKLEAIPSRWPAGGYISSGFGWRTHPLYGGSHFHTGVDIINDYGAPIYATASGRVYEAGYDGGYGYTVKIDHSNGYETLYAHCSSMVVAPGQYVRKGQLIAYIGSTGTATGSHVHYEVKRCGERIDPETCLNTENTAYKTIAMRLKKIQ